MLYPITSHGDKELGVALSPAQAILCLGATGEEFSCHPARCCEFGSVSLNVCSFSSVSSHQFRYIGLFSVNSMSGGREFA